ncbi:ABC transporter substrate-binding protein [Streptacidiphilus albus]|uniref:ABC transporter substrate-binding protein n=1 Tax=Streptacidiphilus albus TaxID=105425 RepID=UPI00054BD5E9|nr:ABC transporter substrate-binding protein [Streptacidiphilus albus]
MNSSKRKRTLAVLATAASAAMALTACSSGSSGSGSGGSGSAKAGAAVYNAGNTSRINPSTATGGTETYELSSTPDSMDPGNTYYDYMWDFSRLYARALTTFAPTPGSKSLTLQPDLATGLGVASNNDKTWTYTIRAGLKFSNGLPITSADVKYAVERSNFAPAVLSNGPTYFNNLLVQNTTAYQGPYKDPKGGLNSIQTPNATTIVFNLSQPFADFDYLVSMPQTAPVPQADDTGANYVKNIISSGPYMFKSYTDGQGAVLVKNPNWTQASDPIRHQYANEIDVKFNVAQTTIDQDLIHGNATMDLGGTGIAPSTQATVLLSPTEKANLDDTPSGMLAYTAISENVAPFNNVHCREAVEYGIDKLSVQTAAGGNVHGDIATTILPPTVTGYTPFNLYPSTGNQGADTADGLASAKAQLALCGQPNGFTTNIAARSDRPGEVAMAEAVQASLAKVGITVNIKQYTSGEYFQDYAGSPAYVHSHDLGLMMMAWAADWPSGYGFLDQILAGNTIKPSGNTNLSELNDPVINNLLNSAIATPDVATRTVDWGTIDKDAMADAGIVPLLYRKDLLYRPSNATNVFVNESYGMYDYANIGLNQ